MSSDEIAIKVSGLSKRYEIYDHPRDRLKQFILPRLARMFGKKPKQFFRDFWALKDISFEVKRGETLGIIGKNGSGKSTLLQLLCGTLSPTAGSIQINGRVAAILELGSGFNPEFTGRENIFLSASIYGLSNKEIVERLQEIIQFADIGDFIDQPAKTYSSGMLVRLAFAVIAHVDADVLVVDEALAVGDAFFTQKCMRFMREFMKIGTVVLVSHDTNAVKSLCEKVLWINESQIKKIGQAKNVCESYLEDFFISTQAIDSNKTLILKKEDQIELIGDQRLQYVNLSNLRNDLEIFSFNSLANSVGHGGAVITSVLLYGEDEKPLAWAVGGEIVTLQILCEALLPLDKPIMGFFVKDALGQNLFGDNTYLSYADKELAVEAGNELIARFTFQMPILPPGEYSICVAIANGTQESHEHQQWIHDAVIFKSHASSVSSGLVGVPMHSVELRRISCE
jgi:lipopolysaccharide transport system ATP-binding protein